MKYLYNFGFIVLVTLFSGCSGVVNSIKNSYYNDSAYSYYEKKDYKNALIFYNKAAQNGDAHAFFKLYVMYSEGEGVEKNMVMANKMLEKSVMLKYPAAQTILGNNLIFADGSSGDEEKGLFLLKEASAAEYVPAYILLYTIYKKGTKSIKKDENKAKQYDRLLKAHGFDIRNINQEK